MSLKNNTDDNGIDLHITLTPKASSNRIVITKTGQIKAYVTVVPEDGKANAALISLLSKHFKVPKSAFTLVQGHTNRHKVIHVDRQLKNYHNPASPA